MTTNQVNGLSEKMISIWMRIHERLLVEEERYSQGERVRMSCAEVVRLYSPQERIQGQPT